MDDSRRLFQRISEDFKLQKIIVGADIIRLLQKNPHHIRGGVFL